LHAPASSGGEAGGDALDAAHLDALFAHTNSAPDQQPCALSLVGQDRIRLAQYGGAAVTARFLRPMTGKQEHAMTTNGNGAGTLGHGYYLEDLSVGMEASYTKKITDRDILAFAELSGDVNLVHLSDDFASRTMFKKRIARLLHGQPLLDRARDQLPARAIYLSQT
jgi:hypothetical protein